ncbi:MAG: hypothetical protein HKO64_05715 [Xanthomonadales bacterium]|nr:hypothetical protein [Xanthomonadales bacterium]
MQLPIPFIFAALVLAASLLLLSCDQTESVNAGITVTGHVANMELDEISGIQRSARQPGVFFTHNDDGEARIYALDAEGANLGSVLIPGASNRDWEDIALINEPGNPMLVIADSGDNFAQHPGVDLYFVPEPVANDDGQFEGQAGLGHTITLVYPDGARDCESVAWDPASDRIILLSKRDKPARMYSIDRSTAMTASSATLEFHGEIHPFRPPTAQDYARFGARDGAWVSQPTGMDISADGRIAAVISYRSLYLFERQGEESWETAFRRKPVEFEGPPSNKEEAVTFIGADAQSILITTEGIPAPVYRFRLIDR